MKEKTKTIRISEKLHWEIKGRALRRRKKIEEMTELLLTLALREAK